MIARRPSLIRAGMTRHDIAALMDSTSATLGAEPEFSSVLLGKTSACYAREGWGPGYRLPGLAHRTGHGIGLDGHETPYLVHADATPLREGMCFSDEPGLYIPGEFGIRLEDCWHMTASGPQPFTPLAQSIDQPV